MKIIPLLLLFFMTVIALPLSAQSVPDSKKNKYTTVNYSKNPVWIDMINDPHVNYFEAVKAYETFWKSHTKPLDEDAMIGQEGLLAKKEKTSFLQRMKEKRELKEQEKYILECKKIEHWKKRVWPYVQEDGSILSTEEQMKIWNTQRSKTN